MQPTHKITNCKAISIFETIERWRFMNCVNNGKTLMMLNIQWHTHTHTQYHLSNLNDNIFDTIDSEKVFAFPNQCVQLEFVVLFFPFLYVSLPKLECFYEYFHSYTWHGFTLTRAIETNRLENTFRMARNGCVFLLYDNCFCYWCHCYCWLKMAYCRSITKNQSIPKKWHVKNQY